MPSYASDVLPDVTGRALGSPSKRYDLFARNIDFNGTLTGSLATGANVTNNTPDTDSVSWQSNNGSGLKSRLLLRNRSAIARAELLLRNLSIQSGDPANGGQNILYFLSALGETGRHVSVLLPGQVAGGTEVYGISALGEVVQNIGGVALYALSIGVSGDANFKFRLMDSGYMVWGAGGATALDVGLKRESAGLLRVTDAATADRDLQARQFRSTMASGTPPFTVVSPTMVANLNAALLAGGDWASPGLIGATARNEGRFTNLKANTQLFLEVATGTAPMVVTSTTPVPNLTVQRLFDAIWNGKVLPDGDGLKHKRLSIVSLAAGATQEYQVFWTTPFSTSNYSVTAGIFDSQSPTGSGLQILRQTQQALDHVGFEVINNDGANAHSGTLHVHAFRET